MKLVLLTIAEAAARRCVSKARIYAAIAQKRLARHYRDGNIVVSEADLLEWNTNGKTGGWPKGSKLSETHRRKISLSQHQRLAKRKATGK